MTNPKISVIVPVYKAEAYLHRCIDSILAQTFSDFEVLLIDDGSPDKSGYICDDYARMDSRVRVFHKENGGVSSARQCGIDNAYGEYTIHADPDDWVEPEMLEELYEKAIIEKVDIVICDFYTSYSENNTYTSQQFLNNSPNEVLNDLLYHRLHGALWNKLIKKNRYSDFNIRFLDGLNTSEDYLICIKILKSNPRIAYLNKAFYHYDQSVNSNSITHQYSFNTYQMHLLLLNEMEKILGDEYVNALYYQKTSIALLAIRYPILTSEEYKKKYKPICKLLFPYVKSFKMKIFFLLSVNGFKELSYQFIKLGNKMKVNVKQLINLEIK